MYLPNRKNAKVEMYNRHRRRKYVFVDPEKVELLKSEQMIEIPKSSRGYRSRMKIVGMPLSVAGDYVFQVEIKEEGENAFRVVAELPLEVKMNLQKSQSKVSQKKSKSTYN